jgi:hypothetical protein
MLDSPELFYAECLKRVSLLLCGVPLCAFVSSVVKVLVFSPQLESRECRE